MDCASISFLLKISASLERESRHPIANALIKEAKKQIQKDERKK